MVMIGRGFKNFFLGTPEKREYVSNLSPQQQQLQEQQVNAGLGPGAGGVYGDSADYYRSNLSNNPADFDAFANPEIRRFNEQTIPGLSEQFAGMGSGGLDSSGFRNAAVNAGTDLSERLAKIRADLRSQSAQGLMNIGQQGLGNYGGQTTTQPGTEGFLSQAAGLGANFLSPALAQGGQNFGNWLSSKFQGGGNDRTPQPPMNTGGQYGNGILNQYQPPQQRTTLGISR
jgi:hypothetical protein